MTTVRAPSEQMNSARRLPPGPPLLQEVESLDLARAVFWQAVKTIAVGALLVVVYAAVAA